MDTALAPFDLPHAEIRFAEVVEQVVAGGDPPRPPFEWRAPATLGGVFGTPGVPSDAIESELPA